MSSTILPGLDPKIRGLLPAPIPPLKKHIDRYLEHKRQRLTKASMDAYRLILVNAFLPAFHQTDLAQLEPPNGTMLIEDFLVERWGHRSPRTYNSGLSCIRDFCKWQVNHGGLVRDPTANIEKARPRPVLRTTFSDEEVEKILRTNPGPREQVVFRLLLFYGIRKGALQRIKLGDFNMETRRLTILTKGEKYQVIPMDDYILDAIASLREPSHHYLLPKQRQRKRRPPQLDRILELDQLLADAVELAGEIVDEHCSSEIAQLVSSLEDAQQFLVNAASAAAVKVTSYPEEQFGDHGLHDYWYRRLARAGVVAEGTTRGRRIHDARHTAAQRVLDHTGSMKPVQALLGHSNVAVTEAYVGYSDDQLRTTMDGVLSEQAALDEALVARARRRDPDRDRVPGALA